MTALTLVRHIRAQPATVFALLSSAEGLASWWGPDDLPVLFAEADVRIGGAYRVRFRTADGREHECAGEFLDVAPTARIVMTWRWTFAVNGRKNCEPTPPPGCNSPLWRRVRAMVLASR